VKAHDDGAAAISLASDESSIGITRCTAKSCAPPNGSRLSCGALKEKSFHNLRAPPASSAC